MIPGLLLALAGVAAIVAAEVIARRSPAQRIGRTLAAARNVAIDEALRIAQAGEPRYVLVHGRISSAEEFPDENDRPLVYRRRRIDLRDADGRWQVASPAVEGVPFGVESRDDYIAVDSAQLERGPGSRAARSRRRGRRPAQRHRTGDANGSANAGPAGGRAGVGGRACQRGRRSQLNSPTARRPCRAAWAGR